MASKKVSICIPVKNNERTLDKTIKSLTELNFDMNELEIIIADNGSIDESRKIIFKFVEKYPNLIKYLDASDCSGGGATRKKLVENSIGEIFVCTDGDIIADPNWIKELVKPFDKDRNIACVGGEILSNVIDENNVIEIYCKQRDLLKVSKRRQIKDEGYIRGFRDLAPSDFVGWYTPFFATANCAYRKDVMLSIGNIWDDNNDDEHFGFMVALERYRQYFTSKAIVYHMHRNTLLGLSKQLYYYGYNHPKLLKQFSKNYFEFVVGMDRREKNYIKVPFLKPSIIFIGWFNLMILSFLISVVSLILNSNLFIISICLNIFSFFCFIMPCFKIRPRKKILYWIMIRLVINLSYLLGVIRGSFKFKCLCIEEPNY